MCGVPSPERRAPHRPARGRRPEGRRLRPDGGGPRRQGSRAPRHHAGRHARHGARPGLAASRARRPTWPPSGPGEARTGASPSSTCRRAVFRRAACRRPASADALRALPPAGGPPARGRGGAGASPAPLVAARRRRGGRPPGRRSRAQPAADGPGRRRGAAPRVCARAAARRARRTSGPAVAAAPSASGWASTPRRCRDPRALRVLRRRARRGASARCSTARARRSARARSGEALAQPVDSTRWSSRRAGTRVEELVGARRTSRMRSRRRSTTSATSSGASRASRSERRARATSRRWAAGLEGRAAVAAAAASACGRAGSARSRRRRSRTRGTCVRARRGDARAGASGRSPRPAASSATGRTRSSRSCGACGATRRGRCSRSRRRSSALRHLDLRVALSTASSATRSRSATRTGTACRPTGSGASRSPTPSASSRRRSRSSRRRSSERRTESARSRSASTASCSRRLSTAPETACARTAAAIAELDLVASLAEIGADRARWVRPRSRRRRGCASSEGRHPLVEALRREEPFIPNDCDLAPERRILLVTGPNMGGKSTYLRQVATIVLLAQAGSFVPAARARALDRGPDLHPRRARPTTSSRGESTFMVEMLESAAILREATPQPRDPGRGRAAARPRSTACRSRGRWSSTCTTRRSKSAFVLFATHYHELTEIALVKPAVVNATMAVKEIGGRVVFLRKVVPGARRPQLRHPRGGARGPAGRRDGARPRDALANLEKQELDVQGAPVLARQAGRERRRAARSSSSPPRRSSSSRSCARLDVNQLTPIAALSLLAALQERLKGRVTARLFGVGISGRLARRPRERRSSPRIRRAASSSFAATSRASRSLERLIAELRGLGARFLFLDQEGGPVDRLRDLLGPTLSLSGGGGEPGAARRAGELAGRRCRAPRIRRGPRAGRGPVVPGARRSRARRALRLGGPGADRRGRPGTSSTASTRRGVGGCVKHFPGLGRAPLDTHEALPLILEPDPHEQARDLDALPTC